MPPRGRPPGRKSDLLHRKQLEKQREARLAREKEDLRKQGRGAQKTADATETPADETQQPEPAQKPKLTAAAAKREAAAARRAARLSRGTARPDDASQVDEANNPTPQRTGSHAPRHAGNGSVVPDDGDASDGASIVAVVRPASPPSVAAPTPAPAASASHATARRVPGDRNGHTAPVNRRGRGGGAAAGRLASTYTSAAVDLDAISHRQLNEDIDAYMVDLDFCNSQLSQQDLTPQEERTLQLRRLDLSHQVRFSQHRIEALVAQRRLSGGRPLTAAYRGSPAQRAGDGTKGTDYFATGTNGANDVNGTTGRHPGPRGAQKRRLSADDAVEVRRTPGRRGRPRGSLGAYKRARLSASVVHDVRDSEDGSDREGGGKSPHGVNGAANGDDSVDVDAENDKADNDDGHDDDDNDEDNDDDDDDTTAAEAVQELTLGEATDGSTFVSSPFASLGGGSDGHSLQRLGFWKCRLCVSEKYVSAAASERLPSAPSKWPLKDVGKLMSHYFDLHTEHEPRERCAELGAALAGNKGPFEYWLRKSRAQKTVDESIIDEVIAELLKGQVPKLLRDLCRAAAGFPSA